MKGMQWVERIGRFVGGAVARIFSPSHDDFPATGAQPFKGDKNRKKGWNDL